MPQPGVIEKSGPRLASTLLFLAQRDLARRYSDSLLGSALSLVQPVLMIALYAVLFSQLSAMRPQGSPSYAAWLIAGVLPWFALSDGLGASVHALTGHAAMVKRTPLSPLLWPGAALTASLMTHAALILAAIAVLLALGAPALSAPAQLAYAVLAMAALMLPLGVIAALANVAARDAGYLVGPVMQLWLWATPIVWPAALIGAHWAGWLALNPLTHLADAYRSALTGTDWPAASALPFWLVTALAMLAAIALYRWMRPILADRL